MVTIVLMIWQGPRGYTLRHAAVVAAAIARHATFAYRLIVLTDQAPHHPTLEVWPLPAHIGILADAVQAPTRAYPLNWPKLWLFSAEAQALGDTLLYVDADSIVVGDLAPLVTYAPDAPFVGMHYGTGKFCGALFRLQTGRHGAVWEHWRQWHAHWAGPADETALVTDQTWMRRAGLGRTVRWPPEMGLYLLKDLDRRERRAPLPADARVIQPTGKTKPWHPRFAQQYPWVKEHYPWNL